MSRLNILLIMQAFICIRRGYTSLVDYFSRAKGNNLSYWRANNA